MVWLWRKEYCGETDVAGMRLLAGPGLAMLAGRGLEKGVLWGNLCRCHAPVLAGPGLAMLAGPGLAMLAGPGLAMLAGPGLAMLAGPGLAIDDCAETDAAVMRLC